MGRYEYWTHTVSSEHYLVRFDGQGLITGVCGPLRQAQIPVENRHNYDYDAQPKYTEWLRQHTSDYNSLAPAAQAT